MVSLTVIIATCGRPGPLAAVLECLEEGRRKHGLPTEVLVVDNHPDATARLVVERWADQGLTVRHLISRPRDKAAALNTGISAARTEWIAFTDDDTLPDPDWLLRGTEYAKRSGLRVFGGRVVPGDDPPDLPRWLRPGRSGRVPGIGVHVGYEPLPTSGALPKGMTAPFGANLFTRRDIFIAHGGYDETLWKLCETKWPVGCEDSEFGHRLHERGEPIGYCREALVVHPVNTDRASIRLHVYRAYCEGWRQPLIFPRDHARPLAPFRLRLLVAHALRGLAAWAANDPAGGAHHLVELARVVGMLSGRYSAAFCRRHHAQPADVEP